MSIAQQNQSSVWPAWLDVIQGVSGLALLVFIWAHMFMVSSILLGKDAMYFVARMFEGEPLLGKPYPILVSAVAAVVFLLFIIHAIIAIRKIPSGYREYRLFRSHARAFKHNDTNLWMVQVISGLVLMFLASGHMYQMLIHPADIGPYASSDRIWSGRWWPLYLVVLFFAELHGGIGVYRLALKWGWFTNKAGRTNRRALQRAKWVITGFFIILGLATLAAYMKLGYEHRHNVGERYQLAQPSPAPATVEGQSN